MSNSNTATERPRRSADDYIQGHLAKNLHSSTRFSWKADEDLFLKHAKQLAIHSGFLTEDRLAPLMRDLQMDGYKGVRGKGGQDVHMILHKKIRDKVSSVIRTLRSSTSAQPGRPDDAPAPTGAPQRAFASDAASSAPPKAKPCAQSHPENSELAIRHGPRRRGGVSRRLSSSSESTTSTYAHTENDVPDTRQSGPSKSARQMPLHPRLSGVDQLLKGMAELLISAQPEDNFGDLGVEDISRVITIHGRKWVVSCELHVDND